MLTSFRLAALSLSLPILLGACVMVTAEPSPENACGAASLQGLVGQPSSVLAAMTFSTATRFIGPDTAVTMDYSAERLNIYFDEAGVITSVACG